MDKLLEELGFSREESQTYLASLALGPATVAQIAKKTGIPRSSTYLLIESLIKLGLVSVSSVGKKTIFVAASPSKLLELLASRKSDLAILEAKLTTSLPQFRSIYNSMPQKPKILFYEGFEGVKTILQDSLMAKEILVLCSGYEKPVEKKLSDYLDQYCDEVDRKGISTLELIGNAPDLPASLRRYQSELHHIKVFPNSNQDPAHIDKLIYGDKIAYISYDFLNGTLIENKAVADFERYQFKVLWPTIPQVDTA